MNFISLHPFSFGSYTDFLTIIAAALGYGLLIGLERERSQQRENQNSFAGLRSFAIFALLGAVCFLFGFFNIQSTFSKMKLKISKIILRFQSIYNYKN